MGRRRRKINKSAGKPRHKKISFKSILVKSSFFLIGIIFIVIFAGYFAIKSYLSGDGFRQTIEQKLAEKIHVDNVDLAPLLWGGSSLQTDSIKAEGHELIQLVDIGKMNAVWDKSALLDQHLKIKDVSITNCRIRLFQKETDESKDVIPAPGDIAPSDMKAKIPDDRQDARAKTETKETAAPSQSWISRHILPNRFSLAHAEIGRFSLEYTYEKKEGENIYAIDNARISINPDISGNEYKINLADGFVKLPFSLVSIGRLDSATARLRKDYASITSLRIIPNDGGSINAEGDWDAKTTRWHANMIVKDMHCTNLISPDWKKNIDGIIEGSVRLKGNEDGLQEAEGSASIDKAVLTALPVLDTLAAFTNTSRFKRISFNSAKADFRYSEESWLISNIVLACDGLLRIEGWISIGDDDSLAGRLQIGIVPGVLSNIPGAEEKIFLPENNANKMGLLWTNVNLSGTTKSPREDLTARLVAAAGERLFEIIPGKGKKALKFSTDIASRIIGRDILPKHQQDENKDEEQNKEDTKKNFIDAIPIRDTIDKAVDTILKF